RSMPPISAFAAPGWSLGAALNGPLLGAERPVPVEDRVAPEERDHATQRQEWTERYRLLPGFPSVTCEEDRGRDEGNEEPDEHRHDDRDPEPCAEERRELDVAHTEPAGIDEHDDEEHHTCAEAAQHPLDARIVDRP